MSKVRGQTLSRSKKWPFAVSVFHGETPVKWDAAQSMRACFGAADRFRTENPEDELFIITAQRYRQEG